MRKRNQREFTRERVRSFKGLENLSDAEADNILDSARRFSHLIVEHYLDMKKRKK